MKKKHLVKSYLNAIVRALEWIRWFFSELWRYCRYKSKVFYKKYRFLRFFTLKNKSLVIIAILLFSALLFCGGMKYEDHRSQKQNKIVTLAGEDSQASTLSPSREDLGNFSISINKIGIVAPVIRGVDPTNKQKYDQALENGVAHMIGTALPGDGKGNIFIYGHSSAIQKSQYDKIFARLNDLQKKDSILLSYNGTVYYYIVTDKKIVEKTDLSVLAPTDKETLTLMTCWPIGADDKRLIVNAIKK